MAALFPALLAVLAAGLGRGLRLAWRIAVTTELLRLAVLGLEVDYFVEAMALPVLILALLLATRQRFRLGPDDGVGRRLVAVVGTTALAVGAAYRGLGMAVADRFEPGATRGACSTGCPPGSCRPPTTTSPPTTRSPSTASPCWTTCSRPRARRGGSTDCWPDTGPARLGPASCSPATT
ncbi:hypothetical protein [Streptomyces sp. TLI_171]|uniref:hypothetical protein n=1 Tax=Streptomyces sp. TLI_171 TaxID=1938859 RepID=UPI00217DB352|nr:hypothetical protein [Streptomyces sp. TLI_171]